MPNPVKTIVVQRVVKKRVDLEKLKGQLRSIAEIGLRGSRGRGWTSSLPKRFQPPTENESGGLVYRASIVMTQTNARDSVTQKFPAIVERIARAGCAGPLKSNPWTVISPEGYEKVATAAVEEAAEAAETKAKANEPKEMGEINLNPGDHFNHIYGRQPQINRIMSALQLGERTDWSKRVNSVLDGEPGCGKTELMRAFAKMLGKKDEAYMWVDATSTTKAGMLQHLLSGDYLPPVMFIEEIEKCEEAALRWLLGVMDIRGQISRFNFRTGPQCENVKMIVIATANDVKLLKSMMSGALYSRFQNKIYCPRPDRMIMKQILTREIAEIKGKKAWIEPALKFAFDTWGMTDPRNIITICSCGGDRLIDGSYQEDYEATMHPLEKEMLLQQKEAAKREADAENNSSKLRVTA